MLYLVLALAGLLIASPAYADEDTRALEGSLIDRSDVVGAGKLEAYTSYGFERLTAQSAPDLNPPILTRDEFTVGAGYGISDRVTAGLQYSAPPGLAGKGNAELLGDLGPYAMFEFLRTDALAVTGTTSFNYDLCGGRNGRGECDGTVRMTAGVGAQYRLSSYIAMFTGDPVGAGPVGQHLSLSLESGGPISFDIPIGLLMQPSPTLGVYVSTKLAYIAISNAGETDIFGADFVPLSLGGLFALGSDMSITADIDAPDLEKTDFHRYAFSLGFRFRN